MALFSPSGGMFYHPYYYTKPKLQTRPLTSIGKKAQLRYGQATGKWVHNPYHVAYRAVKGAGLATAVGAGNFLTRTFRQKPIVGLQTATHKIKSKTVPKNKIIDIPSVSTRRVKKLKIIY